MSTAVVPDSCADVLRDGVEVGQEFFEVTGVGLGVFFQGGVEVGYVGIVVFFVVEVHGLLVDGRFEGVVAVWELW